MESSSVAEILAEAVDAGRTFGSGDHAVFALRHATCTIAAGDRIALVGPSGSGKSTLLHLLAGLDEPTTGLVRWPALGERQDLRPAKVSFVFQTQSLISPLNVIENIEIPLLLQGIAASDARGRAQEMLDSVALVQLADKLPEEISGGQAQRVAVARSLITVPRLLLADEPTGQLDHATAAHLIDLLLSRLDGRGAVVIATHDALVAERFPKRWTIHHGVLEDQR